MSAPSQGFERICDQPNTRSTLLALSCCFYSVAPTQGTVRARPCRPIARIPSPSAALLAKYANTPGRRPRRARRDLDWRDEQSHHCARRRCSSCPLRKSEVVPDRLPRPRTAGPTQPNGRWQRRPRPTANFAGKPASHPDKHSLSQFALPHSSHRASHDGSYSIGRQPYSALASSTSALLRRVYDRVAQRSFTRAGRQIGCDVGWPGGI